MREMKVNGKIIKAGEMVNGLSERRLRILEEFGKIIEKSEYKKPSPRKRSKNKKVEEVKIEKEEVKEDEVKDDEVK